MQNFKGHLEQEMSPLSLIYPFSFFYILLMSINSLMPQTDYKVAIQPGIICFWRIIDPIWQAEPYYI